jgi:hypothetical protein
MYLHAPVGLKIAAVGAVGAVEKQNEGGGFFFSWHAIFLDPRFFEALPFFPPLFFFCALPFDRDGLSLFTFRCSRTSPSFQHQVSTSSSVMSAALDHRSSASLMNLNVHSNGQQAHTRHTHCYDVFC